MDDTEPKGTGAPWRAALLELSKTPRLPRRHAKMVQKLLAKAEAIHPKESKEINEQIRLEIRAAHHLQAAGIPFEHLESVFALLSEH